MGVPGSQGLPGCGVAEAGGAQPWRPGVASCTGRCQGGRGAGAGGKGAAIPGNWEAVRARRCTDLPKRSGWLGAVGRPKVLPGVSGQPKGWGLCCGNGGSQVTRVGSQVSGSGSPRGPWRPGGRAVVSAGRQPLASTLHPHRWLLHPAGTVLPWGPSPGCLLAGKACEQSWGRLIWASAGQVLRRSLAFWKFRLLRPGRPAGMKAGGGGTGPRGWSSRRGKALVCLTWSPWVIYWLFSAQTTFLVFFFSGPPPHRVAEALSCPVPSPAGPPRPPGSCAGCLASPHCTYRGPTCRLWPRPP